MNKKQVLVHSLLLCGFLTLDSTPVQAQITPDSTLGVEASKLTPNVLINGAIADLVNGGAQRGNNLFHSFSEFNIKDGQGVYFGNPSGVVNILTRVTGTNASNILGTLGVDGAANLFLINPNGILFGKNASLDVRGSFVGTTANGIQFGNQGNFSATNPEAPGLLTINPSALFFNQINPNAAIVNNSVAPVGKNLSGSDAIGLRVPDGKSLLLVGGNISMDGGILNAFGGRVELGGASKSGNINLFFDANNLRLEFPENLTRASVSLTNQAKVYTEGAGKGDIAVNAELLEVSNSSLIAGIGTGLGNGSIKGGNININADTISLTSGAFISSSTYGKGDAGDITINTRNLISKDSQLGSIVFGEGSAGTIKIIATDSVELNGEVPDIQKRFPGGILATSDVDVKGKGGYIHLETKRLSISDGSKVQTATFGEGDAGSLFIRAEEIDIFETEKPNVYLTGIFNSVGGDPRAVKPAKGNGGDLTIETGKLSLRSGGAVGVETQGEGNAGSLFIKASNFVEVTGNLPYASEISAGVTETGVGNGGSIRIETPQLNIKDGGQIISSTLGKGDSGKILITTRDAISLDTGYIVSNVQSRDAVGKAGSIDITTGSLSLTNGAQINSFTRGQGNAGNITIKAVDGVSLDGFDTNNNYSALYSNVLAGAIGNGGIINLEAGSLSLTNGGELRVSVNQAFDTLAGGQGIGGTINVDVRDALNISGTDNSGIFASLGTGATGRGGNINIQAGNLSIKDNGEISSTTSGKGDSGKISITTRDAIFLDTGGIYSNVQSRDAVGNAGSIDVTTGSLSLISGAQINSFTRGQGNAGNITIQALNAVTFDGVGSNGIPSSSLSNVQAGAIGNGGNINIIAGSLSLTNGGGLGVSVREASNTLSGGQGIGGTVNINVRDALTISSTGSAIYGSLGTGAVGRGGDIKVQAGNLFIKDNGGIISSTLAKGDSGNIFIAARDAISLDKTSYIANNVGSRNAEGNAGNIDITTGSLSLTNGAQINSFTSGQGNAGNITIQALDAVSFDGVGSNEFPSASFSNVGAGAVGNGGNINITAGSLSLTNGGQLGVGVDEKTNTLPGGQGIGGNVGINVRDIFTMNGSDSKIIGSLGTDAVGRSGNIKIQASNVFVRDGAQINSFTRGLGSAGNIDIQAANTVTIDGNESGLYSVVGNDAIGNGGTVSITSGSLFLNNGGSLGIYVSDASDALQGKKATGGTANINVRDTFTVSGQGSGIFASLGRSVVGTGGGVNIKAGNLAIQDAGEISSNNFGRGNAGNIDITTGSLNIASRAGIYADTYGQGNAGNITVEARDLVEILSDSDLDSDVLKDAIGNAGDITIKTGRLIVRDSQIGSSTFGEGNAGNFKIIATDSVELSGQISKREDDTSNAGLVGFPGGLFAQIDILGKGRGGNLTIETRRLSVSDGSKIQAATFGDGDAGNVFIRAEEIDLFETEKPNFYNAGIFAGVQTDGRVEAGIIDPRNGRPPRGNGGNLTIEARRLSLRNGAEVFVQTTGEGDAGNIFIRASDSVNVAGISTGISERQRTSKITTGASQSSTGSGGSLTIETPLLNVADGGIISSSSEGKGNAGILTINADTIRLNNKASLTANTQSPNIDPNREQATINLNTQALILRRNSNITTNASGANVIGGNININADVLAAFENSDISANSTDSRGGRVKITSLGIFGTQVRNFPTLESDITATGASPEFSGTTELNTPDVEPVQGIIELPEEVVDATRRVAQICPRQPGAKPLGEFTITGRGSLPPSPLEALPGATNTTKLATLEPNNTKVSNIVPSKVQNAIVEAQGWVKNDDGSLELVTMAPNSTLLPRAVASGCPNS